MVIPSQPYKSTIRQGLDPAGELDPERAKRKRQQVMAFADGRVNPWVDAGENMG